MPFKTRPVTSTPAGPIGIPPHSPDGHPAMPVNVRAQSVDVAVAARQADAAEAQRRTGRVAAGRFVAGPQVSSPTAKAASVASATDASEHLALRAAFDKAVNIGGGTATSRLLTDNLEAWNARWRMLEGAKETLDTTYFIIDRDVYGMAFLGHILKKLRQGVHARVMTDAMADTIGKRGFKAHWGGKDYLQELVAAGAEVGIYHPLWMRPFRVLSLGLLACNHDKIMVADRRRSMTGGRNIGRDYFASGTDMPQAWRDTDVEMNGKGPAAGLTAAFDLEFSRDTVVQKVSKDLLGNWVHRDVELLGAYCLMDLWLKAPALTAAEKAALRTDPEARSRMVEDLVRRTLQRLPAEGITRKANDRELEALRKLADDLVRDVDLAGSYDLPASAATETEVKILDQTAVSGGRINNLAESLAELTVHAEKRITIENPYVVLTEAMIQALEAASARGVEIWIGTNSPLSTDSAVTQAFFLEDWAYVLARIPTARIFVTTGDRKLHAKTATVDDVLTFVSTYNLDLLSGYVNSEEGAVIWSKAFAATMNAAFDADYQDPKNGVLEYKIKRHADGKAVLVDGRPVVEFGPEDHLPKKILDAYKAKRFLWSKLARNFLPKLAPLRHPPLR